jgi:hypothetical protein
MLNILMTEEALTRGPCCSMEKPVREKEYACSLAWPLIHVNEAGLAI